MLSPPWLGNFLPWGRGLGTKRDPANNALPRLVPPRPWAEDALFDLLGAMPSPPGRGQGFHPRAGFSGPRDIM